MSEATGRPPIGLYLHIPFCLRKCPYCDFYSQTFDDALADQYTDALVRALRTQPFGHRSVDTVYFGGGTPLLLGAERLGQILDEIGRAFLLERDAEITLEANPAAALGETLGALRGSGFNRISFGVQSLDDAELVALDRLHGANCARQAVEEAAAAGFGNISADVMLAIPGQTGASLERTIEGLRVLPVSHISAYLLKIEDNTPFGRQKNALARLLPDEDAAADLYLDSVRLLETAGFAQYEISNFARPGRESRHNLKYWRCGEYLGLGPAAHSFLDGKRFYFPRDLDRFLAAEQPAALVVPDGDGGGPEERILLRLRLTEGIRPTELLPEEKSAALLEKARALEKRGLVRVESGTVRLTPEGFLLSNTVIASLLEDV